MYEVKLNAAQFEVIILLVGRFFFCHTNSSVTTVQLVILVVSVLNRRGHTFAQCGYLCFNVSFHEWQLPLVKTVVETQIFPAKISRYTVYAFMMPYTLLYMYMYSTLMCQINVHKQMFNQRLLKNITFIDNLLVCVCCTSL